MFKKVYVAKTVFDLQVVKPNMRAIYSERNEGYYCPIDNDFKDYRTYRGVIEAVNKDNIRFISDDKHINLYSDSVHPDIDIWLSPEDIDGYWTKLELEK